MLSLGQKLKMPKRYEKRFFKNVTIVLCKKNRGKKHQIFEKWENFEKRPSCKGYSPRKRYSLGKMLSLGQRLKMPKRSEKRFFNNVAVVLCKKTAGENTEYSRNETILKIANLANAIAHAKAVALAKCSVWVKNEKRQKHGKNDSLRTLQLLCAKSRWKKHQIFEKWDNFENLPSCKGYSPCKGYSLAKCAVWVKN